LFGSYFAWLAECLPFLFPRHLECPLVELFVACLRLSCGTSAMADSWGGVCRQCVAIVADVPTSVLLATVLATVVGLSVLVSWSSLVPAPGARKPS